MKRLVKNGLDVLELKVTTDMRNLLEELNGKYEMTEERISEQEFININY